MTSIETIITIIGSFIVAIGAFYVRQWVQKQRLRRAISTELQQTELLDEAIEADGVPVNDFLQTDILESNIDRLGYFRSKEVEHLINYLNSAKRMNNAIALYRKPEDEFGEGGKPDNLPNIVQGEAEKARKHRNEIFTDWKINPEEISINQELSDTDT